MTTPAANAQKLEIAHKDTSLQVFIDIHEKEGQFRAHIKEIVDGVTLPLRMGFLDFVGNEGQQFMSIRAPIRTKDDNGEFVTRARQKDGKFLNDKGAEVASEAEAAREYVYMVQKNDATKLVYAQIATLNVKNTKTDNTPTAMTMISAKVFSDDEALAAERISFTMSRVGKESPEYAGLAEELKTQRRTTGTWHNFFINAGADVLRAKGFEVREKARAGAQEPSF